MACIGEKAIAILGGNFNSGPGNLITAVHMFEFWRQYLVWLAYDFGAKIQTYVSTYQRRNIVHTLEIE